MQDLSVVSQYTMELLSIIDPIQLKGLEEVVSFRRKNYVVQQALEAVDPYMLYEGREIVFNRWSALHQDRQDPHYAWACIIYFGSFQEAVLEFPELRLKVRVRRGDIVWFRGRDLRHQALEWGEGERHFLIHFTHSAMWDLAGVECKSSKATHM